MSSEYSFSTTLCLNYSKENIRSILENGRKIDCKYLDCGPEDSTCNIIDIDTATELIWSRNINDFEYGPLVYTKYIETRFAFWFYKDSKSDNLNVHISPDHIAWKKDYDLSGWYGINFYKYHDFMLRLIGHHIITNFETYEWFSQPYNPKNMDHDNKIYVKLYVYNTDEIYHHLKVNGQILGITWLDSNKQPINLKSKDNAFEDIFFNEDASPQCWHAMHHNMVLKFSHPDERTFIIEPISIESSATIDQAQMFDTALRTTIELFKNMPVFRLITFKSDEDIININKMDD